MRAAALFVTLLTAAPGIAAAQAPSDTLPLRVAEKQIEAFNRRDLNAVMVLWADDATVSEFPTGKVLWTKEALRDRFATILKSPGVPVVRVVPRVVNGVFVVDNEVWDGLPNARNSAVWMYEIRGGLIRRGWTVRLP